MYNTFESEKLDKLIKEKREYFVKLYRQDPNNRALNALNDEIAFLENCVMPVMLMKTTIFYSSLAKFVTTAFRKVEKLPDETRQKVDGLLLFYDFHRDNQHKEMPCVVMDGNVDLKDKKYDFWACMDKKVTRHVILEPDGGFSIRFNDPKRRIFI